MTRNPRSEHTRAIASVVLVLVGAVVLLAGAIAFYARQQIIDREAFADRAVEALDDDDVRRVVGREIVVNVIDRGSTDLVAARPLLESVVGAVMQTDPFRRLFRAAAVEANRVFFVSERENALFDLSNAAEVLRFGLQSVSPSLAKDIPKDIDPDVLTIRREEITGQTLAIADDIRVLGVVLPLLALLTFAAAVVVAPDRRVGVLRAGVAVGAVGVLLAIALLLLRARVLAGLRGEDELTDEELRNAGAGVLDAYAGDLVAWALLFALGGLVVAGAAAALDPSDIESPTIRLRRRLVERPRTTAGRVLRGVAALALGVFVVLEPALALQVAAIVAGAYLVFFGTAELLALLQRREVSPAAGERGRRRAFAIAGATGAACVAALVVAIVLVTSDDGEQAEGAPVARARTCNGSIALCELRLNEAVFAGTHNSFSAADDRGWYIANQRRGIRRQLEDGIRLLLIDPHWGVGDHQGRVRTDFDSEGRSRNRVAKALPEETLEAAERLVGRLGLGDASGKRDVWLCHTVCELGATRMVDALRDVREFLEENRGEVVLIFIEPYVPPREIAKTFEEAGLDRYLATLDRDEPLPTLGRLVRTNKRVVVFTEKDADGTVPWYLDGFSFVQDTPLGAKRPEALRCRRYRGTTHSPMLMFNHWADVFPPRLQANRPFQRRRFILERARRCARARGLPMSLIAVDHYDQGDLFEAVETLNAERIEAHRRRQRAFRATLGG
ncbi:MAG: hypothetical protein ICV69_10540 [Thermoleophilaceae bacterium]|nr:hypothetical protein [Thermoleophilaceae bacterium]